MDLKSFFDETDHDLLVARVRRLVKDKAMLKLIRTWLNAGRMVGGLTESTDKELEKRGHCFCRYADDCHSYVATQRSGERVLALIAAFPERKLKLKVNHLKSADGPATSA